MNIKSNSSHAWPYIIAGSAIGGAVGYLFMTESGRKFRRTAIRPEELASNLEDARHFIEGKARLVTDQVHSVINKAKWGIEDGERAYREAERKYQSQARQFEDKNNEIASSVHQTVDTMSRSALTVEKSVLDPICELGALYRGIERGIRTLMGKGGPVYRDIRMTSADRR